LPSHMLCKYEKHSNVMHVLRCSERDNRLGVAIGDVFGVNVVNFICIDPVTTASI
jgi:hypothetical protein